MSQRKAWIDLLRGSCCLRVLLDHTEIYYTDSLVVDYNLYVPGLLCTFFFISGYLFKRESGFDIKHKLHSILRGLIIPYFIFTSVIALPKALIHEGKIDIFQIFIGIVTGRASWFVAALVVAQLLFCLIIRLSRERICIQLILVAICFIIASLSPRSLQPYVWQFDNALLALPFLFIGSIYRMKEKKIESVGLWRTVILNSILLVFLKYFEQKNGIKLLLWPIDIDNFLIFLLDTCLTTLLLVSVFKKISSTLFKYNMPTFKKGKIKVIGRYLLSLFFFALQWTGRHTIVYYFFSGGFPLLFSILFSTFGFAYEGNYGRVIILFVPIYAFTSLLAWAIFRYIPIVVGKKKKEKESISLQLKP